jgi:AraC-like DNA-binding protein
MKKPVFQKLTDQPEEGFLCKIVQGAGFDCPWHFHDEYELILVRQSGGYRMVGDNLAALRPNDLVLVGPNLPHIYQNDETGPGRAMPVEAVVIQFVESCVGGVLARLPALAPVRQLLQRARLGLRFTGSTRDRVDKLMNTLVAAEGLPRVLRFLHLLETLAESQEFQTLASRGFAEQASPLDQERMNRVCRHIHERLEHPLSLTELARLTHLSPGAFSRFFHAHTGRTFPQFVNELRLGRACRLLAEGEMNVTEVAFACGFENLSNFNRQFRRLKRTTPSAYRQALLACVEARRSSSTPAAGQPVALPVKAVSPVPAKRGA